MADEFLIFLGIGLAILIGLLVVFSLVQFGQEPVQPRFEEKLVIKTSRFAFEASNIRAQKTHNLGTLELHNGLLFGKKDYAFNLTSTNVEDLAIDMKVKKTNSYGKLMLTANDNVLVNDKLLLGDYHVPVNRSLFNGHVVIEMAPESSSWRIWAPTVYEVDASLDYEVFDKRTDEFTFTLGNETDTLKYVKIGFIFNKNIGDLTVNVNGNHVFSGATDKQFEIIVGNEFVKRGKNVVTFSAEQDSFFAGRGVVTVAYTELVKIQ